MPNEQTEMRRELRAHLRADISKGGHCEVAKESDSLEDLRRKHKQDHQMWGGMLKHRHNQPVQLKMTE